MSDRILKCGRSTIQIAFVALRRAGKELYSEGVR
jgi:hypothetical protein